MKKTVLKRVVAAVLSLAMVVTGLYVVAPQVEEVKAADAAVSVDVYTAEGFRETVGTVPTKDGKVFAGWFTDADCTNPVTTGKKTPYVAGTKYYAKFVDEGILSVKVQLAPDEGETTQMRVLSSVDNLGYKKVGFDVYFGGATEPIEFETQDVFKKIDAKADGVAYTYSNKVIDKNSEYFISGTIKGINPIKTGTDFYIRPFWITADGTKAYGVGKMFSVDDGKATDAFNITIPGVAKPDKTKVTVSVGETTTTAEVVGYEHGNLFLNVKATKANLPSTSKVEYNGVTAIYEKLQSATGATSDTSWYDVNPDADTFYIATAADLWGMQDVINTRKQTFEGKTIVLVSDVALNEGTAYGTATYASSAMTYNAGFTPKEGTTAVEWRPLGQPTDDSLRFNFEGTFDGNGNTISGLVTKIAKDGVGFIAQLGGTLKNLKLKNSYIYNNASAGYWTGALVGRASHATVQNVYVADDVVVRGYNSTAGIVGRADGDTTVSEAWFAGQVWGTQENTGGIVGAISGPPGGHGTTEQSIKIEDCLMTGKVVGGTWSTAGILGVISDTTYTGSNNTTVAVGTTIDVRNCLTSGTITQKNNYYLGTIIGATPDPAKSSSARLDIKLRDVYWTKAPTGWSGAAQRAEEKPGVSKFRKGTLYGIGVGVMTATAQVGNGAMESFAFDWWCEAHPQGVWVVTEDGAPQLKAWTSYAKEDIMQKYTGTKAQVAHTGWYDAQQYINGTKTAGSYTYELETGADMYGFAAIIDAQTDNFGATGDFGAETLKLMADIDLNPGWDATNPETRGEAMKYDPPGIQGRAWAIDNFGGVFDGQGHTIRGVYISQSHTSAENNWETGLFGDSSGKTAVVRNLKMENSYVENTSNDNYAVTGAIAGRFQGTMNSVYVAEDVIVDIHEGMEGGGLVGRLQDGTITNCWFAGKLYGKRHLGGITGCVFNASTTPSIANCMFTGEIHGLQGRNGGIAGRVAATTTISNTFSRGKMYITAADWAASHEVVGLIGNPTLTLDNTFAACVEMWNPTANKALSGKVSIEGTGAVVNSVNRPNADQLFGADAISVFTGFDFFNAENNTDGVWVATANGPELKAFSKSATQVQDWEVAPEVAE